MSLIDITQYSDEDLLATLQQPQLKPQPYGAPPANGIERLQQMSAPSAASDEDLLASAGIAPKTPPYPVKESTPFDVGHFVDDIGHGLTQGAVNMGSFANTLTNPYRWLNVASGGTMGAPNLGDKLTTQLDALGMKPHEPHNETTYKVSEAIGEGLTLPTNFLGQGVTLAQKVGIGALENWYANAFQELGHQVQAGEYNPVNMFLSGPIGAVAGAGGAAVVHGLDKVINKGAQKLATEGAPVADAQAVIARGGIDAEHLSDDDLLAIAQMKPARATANAAPPDLSQVSDKELLESAGLNIPKNADFPARENSPIQENLPYPHYLDLSQESRALPQPELKYPEYLDLSTAPPQSPHVPQPPQILDDIAQSRYPHYLDLSQQPKPEGPATPPVQPAPPPVEPVAGDMRFELQKGPDGQPIVGYHRGDQIYDQLPPGLLDQQTERELIQYAQLKAAKEIADREAAAYADAFYRQFGDGKNPIVLPTKDAEFPSLRIMPPKPERVWTPDGNKAKAAARAKAEDWTRPMGGGVRAVMGDSGVKQLDEMLANPQLKPYKLDNAEELVRLYKNAKYAEDARSSAGFNFKRVDPQTAKEYNVLERIQSKLQESDPNARISLGVRVQSRGRSLPVHVEYQKPQVQNLFIADALSSIMSKAKTGGISAAIDAAKAEGRYARGMKKELEKTFQLSAEQTAAEVAQYAERLAKKLHKPIEHAYRLIQESAATKAAYAQELKAIESNVQNVYSKPGHAKIKVSRKAVSAALLGSGAAYDSMAPAHAYSDGNEPQARPLLTVGGTLAIAGAMLAARPAAVKAFIKSGADKAAVFLGDTLDHVRKVDEILAAAHARSGRTFIPLERELLAATVHAHLAKVGVHFDNEQLAAQAAEELKRGLVSTLEARAGKAGTAFETLNQAQRDAVITFHLVKKTLAGRVSKYMKALDELKKSKPSGQQVIPGMPAPMSLTPEELKALDGFMDITKAHLAALEDGLTKADSTDWMAGLAGNGMDFLFHLNPAFHALNLTDPLISAGSRIGPVKVARAYQLASDPAIAKLFENANFTGSFRGDTEALKATAYGYAAAKGQAKPGGFDITSKDLGSDVFNAKRVAIASFLGSAQELSGQLGKPVDEKAFLTAVMTNSPTADISQTVIDDAWFSMADNTIRTLAVDPLKINRNAIGVYRGSKYFAAFVNQPARIARLLNEYAQNGEFGKIGILVGITAALGGKAAIPKSAQLAWRSADPETYEATASTLDDYSVLGLAGRITRYLAGDNQDARALSMALQRDLSDKVGYDPLYSSYASISPAIDAYKDLTASNTFGDLRDAALSGDGAKLSSSGRKIFNAGATLGLQRALPGGKAIPAGLVNKAWGATQQTVEGESPVWYFDSLTGKNMGKADSIDLNRIPGGALFPWYNAFMPGQSMLQRGAIDAKAEEVQMKRPSLWEFAGLGRGQNSYANPLRDY